VKFGVEAIGSRHRSAIASVEGPNSRRSIFDNLRRCLWCQRALDSLTTPKRHNGTGVVDFNQDLSRCVVDAMNRRDRRQSDRPGGRRTADPDAAPPPKPHWQGPGDASNPPVHQHRVRQVRRAFCDYPCSPDGGGKLRRSIDRHNVSIASSTLCHRDGSKELGNESREALRTPSTWRSLKLCVTSRANAANSPSRSAL
jgi:hypothetical protein